ncbi:TPA: hypothetical protein N0F65_002888 [Lagenidium giganteum]|uniref:Tyrosinase copper-binding domain-containing protein n=1 Tax=Lagenidium giganteum TaxID=4803 RepID=A0AAV2ZC05_9STRA|nr:TPA: hypothetical protein N0F65_002888 [Lagenidium giganteum]
MKWQRMSFMIAMALGVMLAAADINNNNDTTAGSNASTTQPPREQAVSPATSPSQAEQQLTGVTGCGPRIRKSWDMLTTPEKAVYIQAIQRSMDDGLYIKFVEIHTESMTTMEAHQTCMFIYWHRMLLLAFENMLRSYGGAASCITVPYWNYVDHNAQFLVGNCGSMEACAPILRELGGSTRGNRGRGVTINGTPITGNVCVNQPPLDHFCESSEVSGPMCARCVPRGAWGTTPFPPTTSVGSLMRQLFATQTIADVANNIEQGVHNTMHNSLAGVMGNLEAPADPIFWSHHATLDLLHSIYYHCQVGNTVPLTIQQKLANPRQFVRCARRTPVPGQLDRNVLLPESFVMARSGEQGTPSLSAFDPRNVLAPFFAGLPTEYLSYSDVRDLGDLSYNYEITGLLATMFTSCANEQLLLGVPGAAITNTRRELTQKIPKSSMLEAVVHPQDSSSQEWFQAALEAALKATKANGTSTTSLSDALYEVEKMTCMFYDECRGKVLDFSVNFQVNFQVNASTPCRQVIDAIGRGEDAIRVPDWKNVMLAHLRCD